MCQLPPARVTPVGVARSWEGCSVGSTDDVGDAVHRVVHGRDELGVLRLVLARMTLLAPMSDVA